MHIEQELTVELGRPVSFGKVFIKIHTKSDGTFVDFKAEKFVEAYKKNKEAKLSNLDRDISDFSDGHHPLLSIEEDNNLFIQSTFSNDRGQLSGIGSIKKKLHRIPNDPSVSSSFTQMQQKLEEAERKIHEQACLIVKAAENHSWAEAGQQAEIAELILAKNYLLATDPRFHDFMAT